ncbi:MAG: T9SS type A sorting domain-containing protein [Flavobacteriales bacterium]|nr:T9SS type A sorting domain-containing protein [Flavobacteriales bacterium]
MRQAIVTIFLSLHCIALVIAQQQATIMSYNVLNFPTGNIAGREDTLRNLINHVQPDLFLIQELKSDSGLQLILNESFSDLSANYAASTFIPQQSNPSSDFKLQQAIIYNSDLFGMSTEGFLMTSTRDINKFKLYYKSPMLLSGADTIFLYVFVAHLKSSQGAENVAERLSMAQTFTSHLAYLPSNANVILAGDFNLYTSTEPAYVELLDNTNAIQLRDPIDAPGNWNSSSFEPKSVLTQSTRSSAIFGDGAGGGVDDRFDFILLSANTFNNWNTVVYEPDSYYALGNTGSCYNQSITACSGGEWSDEILSSLYYMSDHLPIVAKLNFGVGSVAVIDSNTENCSAYISGDFLEVNWNWDEQAMASIIDPLGRICFQQNLNLQTGKNRIDLSTFNLHSGVYVVRVASEKSQLGIKSLILQ